MVEFLDNLKVINRYKIVLAIENKNKIIII
jgi:hypothetical protein